MMPAVYSLYCTDLIKRTGWDGNSRLYSSDFGAETITTKSLSQALVNVGLSGWARRGRHD
jgi:hypothetical protein